MGEFKLRIPVGTDSEGIEVINAKGCKIRYCSMLEMVPTNIGLECMKLVEQCTEEGHSD